MIRSSAAGLDQVDRATTWDYMLEHVTKCVILSIGLTSRASGLTPTESLMRSGSCGSCCGEMFVRTPVSLDIVSVRLTEGGARQARAPMGLAKSTRATPCMIEKVVKQECQVKKLAFTLLMCVCCSCCTDRVLVGMYARLFCVSEGRILAADGIDKQAYRCSWVTRFIRSILSLHTQTTKFYYSVHAA